MHKQTPRRHGLPLHGLDSLHASAATECSCCCTMPPFRIGRGGGGERLAAGCINGRVCWTEASPCRLLRFRTPKRMRTGGGGGWCVVATCWPNALSDRSGGADHWCHLTNNSSRPRTAKSFGSLATISPFLGRGRGGLYLFSKFVCENHTPVAALHRRCACGGSVTLFSRARARNICPQKYTAAHGRCAYSRPARHLPTLHPQATRDGGPASSRVGAPAARWVAPVPQVSPRCAPLSPCARPRPAHTAR